jgi:hypothetical protein
MASQRLVSNIMTRARVPAPQNDERMGDVRPNTFERPLGSSSDFVSSIMGSVLGKRRFTGGEGLDAMRSVLPGQLGEGLRVIDTGFSDTHGQTDQLMSSPIFAKAFQEAWQMDYVEGTPLFVSASEPESAARSMHTVASPQVLNFALELRSLRSDPMTKATLTAGALADLEDMAHSINHLSAKTPTEFAERVNYLGPMVNVQDRTPHSSYARVRRGDNAERMLSYSIYDRARIFNFFGDNLVKGDYLFWCVKQQNLDHQRDYVDPRGRSVVARRKFPASSLQVVGMSSRGYHSPVHNSSYDPTALNGPTEFTDPRVDDTDFTMRIEKLARDYSVVDFDEISGEPSIRSLNDADNVSERVRAAPSLVYDAYMTGYCMKVGYARSFDGRNPTASAILAAHRSHEDMMKLQSVVYYNI